MTDSSARLLADDYWSFHRGSAQLWNIDRGDVEQIEHWEDFSAAGVAARVERLRWFADRAEAITTDSDVADGSDRILLAAVRFSAQSIIDQLPYARDLTLVAGSANLTTFLTVLVPGYGLTSARDGRGFVAKLRGLPTFVDGVIDGLRDGRAAGRCATARGVTKLVDELDALLAAGPATDPLLGQEAPSELSEREVARWRSDVLEAVRHDVHPALARLRTTLRDDLLPNARPDDVPGVCHLPGGGDAYGGLLRAATSTDLSAAEVHAIGLRQLELLDDRYSAWGAALVGSSDPSEIRRRLRDDPQFRYSDVRELVADAHAALARANQVTPSWFGRLPSSACAVALVRSGPLAYYTGPAPDGGRGGTCHFNVADPALWTRFGLEGTMFHESVPGHHLQVALAQELDLHPVVGELEVTSYGEGWGLYAEQLADEMGLYSGPLQRLGMLTLDSLRAARLVVDTGLHALGWTRSQAIDVMEQRTSLEHTNAAAEVDRYIADPGQATSYMVGRLELDRLRDESRARLGDRFSPASFHDTVLGSGMMPLSALADVVDNWVAGELTRPSGA